MNRTTRQVWKWLSRYYFVLVIALTICGLIAYVACFGESAKPLEATTVATGIVALMFALQKQRLDEMSVFVSLFKEFNARYDVLNEALNELIDSSEIGPLTKEQRDLLDNYFNLCAEEYLCYQKGYIFSVVWSSWQNGMTEFFRNPRVRSHWHNEQKKRSYYGLEELGLGE